MCNSIVDFKWMIRLHLNGYLCSQVWAQRNWSQKQNCMSPLSNESARDELSHMIFYFVINNQNRGEHFCNYKRPFSKQFQTITSSILLCLSRHGEYSSLACRPTQAGSPSPLPEVWNRVTWLGFQSDPGHIFHDLKHDLIENKKTCYLAWTWSFTAWSHRLDFT
jgi:hypothetical protein